MMQYNIQFENLPADILIKTQSLKTIYLNSCMIYPIYI